MERRRGKVFDDVSDDFDLDGLIKLLRRTAPQIPRDKMELLSSTMRKWMRVRRNASCAVVGDFLVPTTTIGASVPKNGQHILRVPKHRA